MAFSQSLAARIRDEVFGKPGIIEKKMFGGLVFLLDGNMLIGIWKDALIARVGPEQYEDALLESHVREFDITGRPMKGWVLIDPEGIEEDDQLRTWIDLSWQFVSTLPAK